MLLARVSRRTLRQHDAALQDDPLVAADSARKRPEVRAGRRRLFPAAFRQRQGRQHRRLLDGHDRPRFDGVGGGHDVAVRQIFRRQGVPARKRVRFHERGDARISRDDGRAGRKAFDAMRSFTGMGRLENGRMRRTRSIVPACRRPCTPTRPRRGGRATRRPCARFRSGGGRAGAAIRVRG